MNVEQLESIKERAEMATSGPWFKGAERYVESNIRDTDDGEWTADNIAETNTNNPFDAEFIAHARDDVPELVATVEKLYERLAKCESLLGWAHDVLDDVHCYDTDVYAEISEYFDGDDSDD